MAKTVNSKKQVPMKSQAIQDTFASNTAHCKQYICHTKAIKHTKTMWYWVGWQGTGPLKVTSVIITYLYLQD